MIESSSYILNPPVPDMVDNKDNLYKFLFELWRRTNGFFEANNEPSISSGDINQYWAGDKTWKLLDTSARTAISDTVPGLTYDNASGVLSLDDGYDIPTTAMEAVWNSKEPGITPGTSLQYWRGDKTWQTLNTAAVPELTNLYYLDSRARLALSSSATGLTYTNTTGDFSLTSGYVIPTTTEESNWNSAYAAAVTNATALDTPNTIVKRDANGRTAVSLSDDTAITPRISVNHNDRFLVDRNGYTSIDWDAKLQYGLDDRPLPHSHLQVDYQNSQLSSWYKYAISFRPLVWGWAEFMSLDWKQCQLLDVSGVESINWDGHYGNAYDATVSIDFGSRYLLDHYGNASIDWEGYILSNQDGFMAIRFGNGVHQMYDTYSYLSVDYDARALLDGSFACIDWGNRNLCNTSGTPVLNFSTGIKPLNGSTGSGTALLGANCPATFLTAPYTWIDIIAPDGTACVMPIWKK